MLALLILVTPVTSAIADEPGTTTFVNPNSTTVTVLPNSTTVTLAPGQNLPPGAVLAPPPGIGAAGTTPITGDPGTTTPPPTSTSTKIEFTEEQIASLPAEQRAAALAALAQAQASAPATVTGPNSPNIPSSITGLTSDILKHFTPSQLQLVEQAKTTGQIPSELRSMLVTINEVPGDVYAKLTDQQKEILEKAKTSGILDKTVLHDILDGLTAEEVKAFSSGRSISTNIIKKATAKKAIICISGKKEVTLLASNCPKGFKKK